MNIRLTGEPANDARRTRGIAGSASDSDRAVDDKPDATDKDEEQGTALITGASRGIGAAFARELVARGWNVVLVARSSADLDQLTEELCNSGTGEVRVFAADLTDAETPAELATQLAAAQVDITLLINNAGIGSDGRTFDQTPLELMLKMVDLHCRATLELTHRLLPAMLAPGSGGVIFTSSIAGFIPTPNYAVYGATKAFDLLLAESLWAELRERGVQVLALSPGRTDTAFFDASGRPGAGLGAMDPGRVARQALKQLGRGPTFVPGLLNRWMTRIPRVLPRRMTLAILSRVLGERGHRERREHE